MLYVLRELAMPSCSNHHFEKVYHVIVVIRRRVGLGLGEGFAFPSVHAMIAENVPKDQRSTVVSEPCQGVHVAHPHELWARR